jgi:hypothetical protein
MYIAGFQTLSGLANLKGLKSRWFIVEALFAPYTEGFIRKHRGIVEWNAFF